MLKRTKWFWLTVLFVGEAMMSTKPAGGHGVVTAFLGSGALVVEAYYTDGEAMNYAKVTVYAPQKETPFQSGYTDANGRFAFLPDKVGKWKVIFADGMGHRSEQEVSVKTPPTLVTDDAQPSLPP
jgi:nickel transport protein